ncbi:MAG: hypothetical protein WD002_14030 [Pseudomonadales bacterium]
MEDPKDGLLLFGPPGPEPMGTHYGVIGTPDGIAIFQNWARRLNRPILADPNVKSSVTFPGFETVFRTSWESTPRVTLRVDPNELYEKVHNTDAHQRVFDTVKLFSDQISRWTDEEDEKVAFWFVIVPDDVYRLCRPKSTLAKKDGVEPEVHLTHKQATNRIRSPDLFEEMNEAAEKHLYENHFHNQLKARLLGCQAVTQLLCESTIVPREELQRAGKKVSRQDDATIAWNISTTIYYKAGAKPWTLADIREGVCYVGLVFKKTNNPNDEYEACCGAQMFLDSGEGIVFKGSIGSWGSDKRGEFHLPREQAAEIIKKCVASYELRHGKPPTELFIHGRTYFDADEIRGFREGAPDQTKVTGIQIRRTNDLKLFRAEGKRAVLRSLALELGERSAFLWSSGYVPHLLTYPGREVPTPLKVNIVFGDTDLQQVLKDIMSLTKLNFNTCIYGDGFPVTLRFADDVGEILTAVPEVGSRPLPFRHYI